MVVDGRRRQALVNEMPLPAGHVPLQADREAVVAVGLQEELAEAKEVQLDLGGHRG